MGSASTRCRDQKAIFADDEGLLYSGEILVRAKRIDAGPWRIPTHRTRWRTGMERIPGALSSLGKHCLSWSVFHIDEGAYPQPIYTHRWLGEPIWFHGGEHAWLQLGHTQLDSTLEWKLAGLEYQSHSRDRPDWWWNH